MKIKHEESGTESTIPYQSFISFVAFSLIIKFLPYFEKFTTNTFFKVVIGLSFVVSIVFLLIRNATLPKILRDFCSTFKIKVYQLYVLYICAYLTY